VRVGYEPVSPSLAIAGPCGDEPLTRMIPGKRTLGTISFGVAVLLASICLSSCRGTGQGTGTVKRYQLHGQIVRLDPQAHSAVINHEKIEGWMEAMTMEFPVKDRGEFRALHVGDSIAATVFVRDLDYWIGEIRHQKAQTK
jgi:Cu/Ag efflux protein CusF